ncbi:MAG: type II toxin-antitoxin system VapC family toxin [Chloroflexota bacterium]|nr:type II toxin-antitoxin system VapC family toxin [Chloroflexota bacterium]
MNTYLVIDASFAFNLILPGPRQKSCQTLVTQWYKDGYVLCAPTLWLYEITSALCKGVHFGQITRAEGRQTLLLAQKLGVQLFSPDDAQTTLAFNWTMQLKRAAAYDSFYLALAKMLSTDLWTADKRLVNAAGVSWIHLIP